MAFRESDRAFSFAIAARVLLAALCAFFMLELWATTYFYASGLALGCLGLLILWDLGRIRNVHPVAGEAGGSAQREWLQHHDRAIALLDAVTVALIALTPDGRISFANRAARLLAKGEVGQLTDVLALGTDAAKDIIALPPGSRRILTLSDGRQMLVWVVGFSVPGEPGQKLLSLQAVAGELDAVQVRAWQEMAHVLSHEIMNSLTPIASLSESIAKILRGREDADPTVASAAEAIARRSLHLLDFVERYRQVADLPEPRLRPVRVTELVATIESLLQTGFAARHITYQSAVRPNHLMVSVDPELLSQAVINLLHNAVEAVATVAEPSITLVCEEIGADFVCTVSDNGPGIPPERLQEVFVPFFTTKAQGSGIGLTLARQVALAHGGRIEALENPGGGARLRITLTARN